MGRGIARFFVHELIVETNLGEGGTATVFATPVTVSAFVEASQKVTATSKGDVVTLEGPVYAGVADADALAPLSRVTWNGIRGKITARTVHLSGSNGLPDHVEITLG